MPFHPLAGVRQLGKALELGEVLQKAMERPVVPAFCVGPAQRSSARAVPTGDLGLLREAVCFQRDDC